MGGSIRTDFRCSDDFIWSTSYMWVEMEWGGRDHSRKRKSEANSKKNGTWVVLFWKVWVDCPFKTGIRSRKNLASVTHRLSQEPPTQPWSLMTSGLNGPAETLVLLFAQSKLRLENIEGACAVDICCFCLPVPLLP